jgi:uncharacterized membrane protein
MDKFKTRYDTFSDAVLAILLTIMVLDLPIKMENNARIDYQLFFEAVGIFAISFCVICNVWFRHALAFNISDSVSSTVIIVDLVMLLFCALIPAMTSMMIFDVDSFNVMLYGAVSIIVSLLQSIITVMIVSEKYSEHLTMRRAYSMVHGRFGFADVIVGVILVILAYWFPNVSLVLFIIFPITSFIGNYGKNQDFSDLDSMNEKERNVYFNYTPEQRRQMLQMLREYRIRLKKSGLSPEEQRKQWMKDVQAVQEKLGKRIKAQNPQEMRRFAEQVTRMAKDRRGLGSGGAAPDSPNDSAVDVSEGSSPSQTGRAD